MDEKTVIMTPGRQEAAFRKLLNEALAELAGPTVHEFIVVVRTKEGKCDATIGASPEGAAGMLIMVQEVLGKVMPGFGFRMLAQAMEKAAQALQAPAQPGAEVPPPDTTKH
jgi:hypothetical protein